MADIFELNAESRTERGKAAARRMRRDIHVPANIYGAGKEPQAIKMVHKDLMHALENEAFFSHILTINVDGKPEKVVIKDLERHPSKPKILHADFMRINMKDKLTMLVPLHFTSEEDAPGAKEGGVASKLVTELEIRCLPTDLPEYIEVDVASVEMGGSLHLSDIKLPKGVELTMGEVDEEHDHPIYSIHAAKVEAEPVEEEAAAEEGAEEAAAEGEAKAEEASEEKSEE